MSRGLREDRREGEVLARWIAGLLLRERGDVVLANLASMDRSGLSGRGCRSGEGVMFQCVLVWSSGLGTVNCRKFISYTGVQSLVPRW